MRERCKRACHLACLPWQGKTKDSRFRKKWWQRGGWPETVSVRTFSVLGARKPHQTGVSKLPKGKVHACVRFRRGGIQRDVMGALHLSTQLVPTAPLGSSGHSLNHSLSWGDMMY